MITAALASAKNAMNLLKGLAETVKATGKIEAIGQILELQSAMLEMQLKQQELITRIGELEEEDRKLKAEAGLITKLEFTDDIYRISGHGNFDGFYCPRCFDGDKKLARLHHGDKRASINNIYNYYDSWGWMT